MPARMPIVTPDIRFLMYRPLSHPDLMSIKVGTILRREGHRYIVASICGNHYTLVCAETPNFLAEGWEILEDEPRPLAPVLQLINCTK